MPLSGLLPPPKGTAVPSPPASVWTLTPPRDLAPSSPAIAVDVKTEQTLDLFYQSTRDPNRLTPALQGLRRLLEATRVAYVLPVATVCVEADALPLGVDAHPLDDERPDAWCTPDDALKAASVGFWPVDEGLGPSSDRIAAPAVHRFAAKLHAGDPGPVFLFVERARSLAAFGAREAALLTRLLPDLARVSRLHGDMALSLPAMAARMVVDTLRVAHCVVDADHALIHANAPMQALLDGRFPIGRSGSCLRFATARDEALLQEAIAAAAAEPPRQSHFHTTGTVDGRRLSVQAVPMHARARASAPDDQASGGDATGDRLVLLIVGQVGATELTPDILHHLYDMSPAEARAALQVLSGGSGGDMAERLGISLSTFKTQLQAAYAKTGTRRRTELMRLLLAPGWRAS